VKRLLLFLLAAGIAFYLARSHGLLPSRGDAGGGTAPAGPLERARAAAAANDARVATGDALAREIEQPGGGAVSDNMTPDQVRALLGPPDEVSTEATPAGASREIWTYRSVGKSVVFENGIVAAVR
jgi:hypothetical protein